MKVVTGRIENQCGKRLIIAFGFLDTEHVRLVFIQPVDDGVQANPDGIHIVGRNFDHKLKGLRAVNLSREEIMAETESSSSSVASVAIVVIILLAIFAFYFLFGRGVHANREINVDIKTPQHEVPIDKR